MTVHESLMNALDELNSTEIKNILTKCPEAINYIITSTQFKYSQCGECNIDIDKCIIRLAIAVSNQIGGVAIYMPYHRDKVIMDDFVHHLVDAIMSKKSLSSREIEELIWGNAHNLPRQSKWSFYMESILKVLQNEVDSLVIGSKQIRDLMLFFIESFLICFSGRARSFPACNGILSILRSRAVYREFSGDNVNELSFKYGVGMSVIYGYIRSERSNLRFGDSSL